MGVTGARPAAGVGTVKGPRKEIRVRSLIPALVLATAGLGCASMNRQDVIPPDVHVSNLALLEATVFEQRMRLDLRVSNPNDFDLPIDGLRFELRLQDQVVARGVSDESVKIPRLGDGVVPVTTTTSSVALIKQFVNAPKDGRMPYELKGTVYLKGFSKRKVEFEESGVMPLDPTASQPPI